jgi:hypothetical protein
MQFSGAFQVFGRSLGDPAAPILAASDQTLAT